MKRHGSMLLMVVLAALATAGCGDDDNPAAPQPQQQSIKFTFDNDSEGWTFGLTSVDWGKAEWASKSGGVLELDGVGNSDPEPNAWVWKEVALPASTTALRYKSSAHNRGDGTGFLRVRLQDGGGNFVTLLDWEMMATGPEGYEFATKSLDISAYKGQTVKIYFELDDVDGGANNQRYVDDVEILH